MVFARHGMVFETIRGPRSGQIALQHTDFRHIIFGTGFVGSDAGTSHPNNWTSGTAYSSLGAWPQKRDCGQQVRNSYDLC